MRLPTRGLRGRGRNAGFTLLEVIVAFAVLSLAIVVGIQGFAAGLRLLKLSGEHQQAMLLADQKLREITTPTLGHDSGAEGPFAWERSTRELAAPDLDVPGRTSKWHVYQIDVTVTWGDGKRRIALASLRTQPDISPGGTPAATGAPRPPGTSPQAGTTPQPGTTLPGTTPQPGTTRSR